MKNLLQFFSLPYFRHRPLKVLLTLIGMASGIAVFTAIQISNQSILKSTELNLQKISGGADLNIRRKTQALTAADYLKIKQLPQVQIVAPIVEAQARCAQGQQPALTLLGIDPLSYGALFAGQASLSQSQDFLKMMGEPGLALVPKHLSQACELKPEDPLSILLHGKKLTLPKIFFQTEQTPWRGSNLIFFDLASLQEIVGEFKNLTRLELQLEKNTDLQAWIEKFEVQFPHLQFTTQDKQLAQGTNLLKAFQYNLLSLGLVSIFVAIFIVYNAASLSVLHRRQDLGILRSLGLSQRQSAQLILVEMLVLGIFSSILGLLLGWGLAKLIFGQILTTVQQLYLQDLLAALSLNPTSMISALALGIFSSLLGGLLPLWEVLKIAPAEATRKLSYEKHLKRHPWILRSLALLCAGFAYLSFKLASIQSPHWGLACAFLALLSFLFLTPLWMKLTLTPWKKIAERFHLPLAQVSSTQILENPYRYSVVTAALALALALWLAIGMMVTSFRQSLEDWIHLSFRADLYLTLADNERNQFQSFVPESVLQKIAELPGIQFTDRLRKFNLTLGEQNIAASAIELNRLMKNQSFQLLAGNRKAFAKTTFNPQQPLPCAVSESLARRQNLKVGDHLTAPTPWGEWDFEVAAIFYDYSSQQGILFLEYSDFFAKTQDPKLNGVALFLQDPQQSQSVLGQIQAFPDLPATTELRLGQDLGQQALQVFDQTFQVTQALRAVALLVAFLGILSTLALLIEEKRRELGIFQALGMSPRGVSRYAFIQGLMIAWAGFGAGVLAGLTLCWILLKAIHYNFFGWSIFFFWNGPLVLKAFFLTLSTGGLASLVAAWKIAQIQPSEALRFEE